MKIDKVKEFLSKYLTYFLTLLFCLNLTFLKDLEIFHYIYIGVICLSFILLFLNYKYINFKNIKKYWYIWLYLFFRIVSICINNNFLLNFKGFIYECFFLINVNFLLNKSKKVININENIIIITNLVLNVISVIFQYFIKQDFSRELFGIYSNPNGLAILTLVSIILFYKKNEENEKKFLNIVSFSYYLFSVVVIYVSYSRTCIYILIILFIINLLLNKNLFDINKLKKFSFICIYFFLIFFIAFSYLHKNETVSTKFEKTINNITTNRYYLWKYSLFSLENKPLLGIGNLNIGVNRYNQVPKKILNSLEKSRANRLSMNNNHNGYFQLLVSSGLICFILFTIYIYKLIMYTSDKYFYLIIAILIINIFENELIISTSLGMFLLAYFNVDNKVLIGDRR